MQNLASGMQISPHFVVDVKLKEHFDLKPEKPELPDKDPDAFDGDPTPEGPKHQNKLIIVIWKKIMAGLENNMKQPWVEMFTKPVKLRKIK